MEIVIPAAFDCHVHLRQGDMLHSVAPWTAQHCDRAIVMPNLEPPICSVQDVIAYRSECSLALGDRTMPLMTAKLTENTTPELVRELKNVGVVGMKLYPSGVTTNSNDGISRSQLFHQGKKLCDVFAAMEEIGLPLLNHGEMPGEFCMDREDVYLSFIHRVLETWPGLKVTLEHITTAAAVDFIRSYKDSGRRIVGTITLHHMMMTLDDVIGDKLRPDLFCKPIPKRESDRRALVGAAVSGDDCFLMGSDSAPHERRHKHCEFGCAGVFTAPILIPAVTEIFHDSGAVNNLAKFTSLNAEKFYGVGPSGRRLKLVNEKWTPSRTVAGTVTSFLGGTPLNWDVMSFIQN